MGNGAQNSCNHIACSVLVCPIRVPFCSLFRHIGRNYAQRKQMNVVQRTKTQHFGIEQRSFSLHDMNGINTPIYTHTYRLATTHTYARGKAAYKTSIIDARSHIRMLLVEFSSTQRRAHTQTHSRQ